jgi:lipoate-protein ligase A
MKRWRFIGYAESPGEKNMKIDSELFMECESGHGQPTLRFYGWEPWCVSIGRNQSMSVVNMEGCRRAGIDVVRRITGGGALLHAEEIVYSIIGYSEQPPFGKGVAESYKLTHGWLISCFKKLGIQAELNDKNSGRVDICFSDVSSYEIHVNGKKLVGSAQRRGKRAILQHGSILLKSNPLMTSMLLNPPDGQSREEFYEHLKDRAVGLIELNGTLTDKDALIDMLLVRFNEQFGPVISSA